MYLFGVFKHLFQVSSTRFLRNKCSNIGGAISGECGKMDGMDPNAAPTMIGIVSVFTPHILVISTFCQLLWLSVVFFHRYGIISQDNIRLVSCHSSVSVDLLIIQICVRTHFHNRGWNVVVPTPWVIHPFHILGRYSNEDIDKFYCASLGIHVLPASDNRKLNDGWFPIMIYEIGVWELPPLNYRSLLMPDLVQLF